MAECAEWLRLRTLGGLWRLLRRLRIRLKRGRSHIHSPDPAYELKRTRIEQIKAEVRSAAAQSTAAQSTAAQSAAAQSARGGQAAGQAGADAPMQLLYLDEVSYHRQPTLARNWCEMGRSQPYAERSTRSDSEFRVVGALDACDGRLHWLLRNRITVPTLRSFYAQIVAAYPGVERLYLVVDNWPVHYHPNLLMHLVEQPYAAEFITPRTWPKQPTQPVPPASQRLPVVLVPLPTYASWLNPIEKVWGLSRQVVSHLHPWADALDTLKAEIGRFCNQFAAGSQTLLRTVGLLPE